MAWFLAMCATSPLTVCHLALLLFQVLCDVLAAGKYVSLSVLSICVLLFWFVCFVCLYDEGSAEQEV